MNAAYRAYFPAASMPARATVKVGLTSPDYLLELTMVAAKGLNRKTIITPNPDGTPGIPNPNLSSAIQAGTRLYLAGIPGNTSANTGDVKAQTEESLARIERTLKTAGYDWSNVDDSVVYLQDMKDYQTMNAVYRAKLGKDFPARATVGVGLMGTGAAVEIMMTASK
jgi:2-iminobutanoate/2-iminopropanoate deaminase